MKYPVLKTFRDKYTKVVHEVGTPYETNIEERATELQGLGFIGKGKVRKKAKSASVEPGDSDESGEAE